MKVSELAKDVGVLRTEVGDLRTDVGSLRAEVGDLRTDVGELRTEVGDLGPKSETSNGRRRSGEMDGKFGAVDKFEHVDR